MKDTVPSEVAHDEVLHRAIKRSHLYWDPNAGEVFVKLEAFKLRPPNVDKSGLSVDRARYRSINDTVDGKRFRTARGLHAYDIRGLGLEIVPTDYAPHHANIEGLPYGIEGTNSQEDVDLAERYAQELRSLSFKVHDIPEFLVRELKAEALT
jgi:hypothetical protein